MSRVFITAAGVASPLGTGTDEFYKNLHNQTIGVDTISSFDISHFPSVVGGEVRKDGCVVKLPSRIDRKEVFIKEAVSQLPLEQIRKYKPEHRLLHMGTGIDYFDFFGYIEKKETKDWTDFSLRAHAIGKMLADEYEITGGHFVNVSACVASTQAIGLSYKILKKNNEIMILTGGFDSMLSHIHYMGFYSLGALSTWKGESSRACRPFDKNRSGLVIGEGGVAYILEGEEFVNKENILCEIVGYATTMDSYMVTDPHPDGSMLALAAKKAFDDAGITADAIDAVDMHGTGTIKNALAEFAAMKQIFPERYKEIPVFALKGQIGHLIGACGAMELLGVIDMIRHQRILPSVNCDEPDPQIPLRLIQKEPLSHKIDYVLKINAAFGGQNTAMVIQRYDP